MTEETTRENNQLIDDEISTDDKTSTDDETSTDDKTSIDDKTSTDDKLLHSTIVLKYIDNNNHIIKKTIDITKETIIGDIIENALSIFQLMIYNVGHIYINTNKCSDDNIEIHKPYQLNKKLAEFDNINYNNIHDFTLYEIKRNDQGNVIPNGLPKMYNDYILYKEDKELASSYERTSRQPAYNTYTRTYSVSADNYLSEINNILRNVLDTTNTDTYDELMSNVSSRFTNINNNPVTPTINPIVRPSIISEGNLGRELSSDTTSGVATSSPVDTTSGVATSSPVDTTSGVATSSPVDTTSGVATSSPVDTTSGVATSSPVDTTSGVATSSPVDTTSGVATSSPVDTTSGVATSSPVDTTSGVATSSPVDTTSGVATSSPDIQTTPINIFPSINSSTNYINSGYIHNNVHLSAYLREEDDDDISLPNISYTNQLLNDSFTTIRNNLAESFNSILNREFDIINEDVKVTASESELDKLNYTTYEDIKKQVTAGEITQGVMGECSICIESLEDSDEVLYTKCSHIFHKHCITKWISEYNVKCPICKEDVANGTAQIK